MSRASEPTKIRTSFSNLIVRMLCGWLFVLLVFTIGCKIDDIDSARRFARIASLGTKPIVEVNRQDPLQPYGPIRKMFASRSAPSDRTQLFLRKNDLSTQYKARPQEVVQTLQENCRCEPDMESVHAIAELSELEAEWNLRNRRPNSAAKFYAQAVVHAYQFLFDSSLNLQRNAYDPQFREICDIYNSSLEYLLRLVVDSDSFKPGTVHLIGDKQFGIELELAIEGRWSNEEFERFELVNDFKVEGIDNSYHTYGLGVPLIAVRKGKSQNESRSEKYYPPSLSLPLTAFCDVVEFDGQESGANLKAVLRLFDPLERTVVETETRVAPLESDFTVPLAYYLNDPLLKTDVLSTVSLFDAEITQKYFGFYMLEPFDPEKIPVVMVHGLWSNPVTWMKMFNDLRANEWIRDHYQFWFYMYPTGQPFWFSAQEMREDLVQLRSDIDPEGNSQPLKEMILVGHSMGGLLSRMQTVDSGDQFWNIVSEHPIDEIKGDFETVKRVKDLFYFQADPNINRVITIASPHRGSSYANNATRWLSQQLFRLPSRLTSSLTEFCDEKS